MDGEKRLMVYFHDKQIDRDKTLCLPVTEIRREENVICAYNGEDFVGWFDLGAIEMLYVNEVKRDKAEA